MPEEGGENKGASRRAHARVHMRMSILCEDTRMSIRARVFHPYEYVTIFHPCHKAS